MIMPRRMVCFLLPVLSFTIASPLRAQPSVPRIDFIYPAFPQAPLSLVSQGRFGPDGALFIIDLQADGVIVIQRDGSGAELLGRAGEGPGEFSNPANVGFRHDSLWVVDSGSYRISLFDSERRVVRTVAVPSLLSNRTGGRYRPRGLLSDGSIILNEGISTYRDAHLSVSGMRVVRCDPGLGEPRMLFTVDIRNQFLMLPLPSGGTIQSQQPFGWMDLWGMAPDGTFTVHLRQDGPHQTELSQALLTVYRPDGRIAWTSEITRPAHTLQEQDIRRWMEDFLSRRSLWEAYPSRESALSQLRSTLYLPAATPLASELVVGGDHRIWLRLGSPNDENTWLMIAQSTVPREVEFPAGIQILDSQFPLILGVRTGAFDVPELVLFELTSPTQ